MKRYLTGIIAVAIAFVSVAFTNVPKVSQLLASESTVAPASDPCSLANKKWFIITKTCLEQTSFSVLTNAMNYTLSTSSEVTQLCDGEECICAIFACANTANKPIISSTTTIYTDLYNFWNSGVGTNNIALKNQYWGR